MAEDSDPELIYSVDYKKRQTIYTFPLEDGLLYDYLGPADKFGFQRNELVGILYQKR